MKNLKKLFSVVLTLVLSFCMISAVSAENNGTITISGTTAEKTYEIYRIFDLTLSDGGKIAYTINSDWTGFFATGKAGANYISTTAGTSTIVIDGVVKYIDVTENNVADFAQDALEYASKNKIAADYSDEAEGTSLVFNNLELGYYLVYPKGATDIKESYASICSLTSTTPNADVNIKATYPEIDKTVDDYSVEVGQIVEFAITGLVPDTTGYTTYTYEIKDTMNAGLLFNEEIANLIVTINGVEVDATDYDISYSNNGFTLTFDMTEHQENVSKEIKVVYNAKVTYEAINSDTTKNSATLTYSNNPKDATKTTTTPPVIKYVYSADLKVLKVDGADKTTPLTGAEFVLKNADGKYYQITDLLLSEDFTIAEAKVTGFTWVDRIEDATVFTSGEDGYVTAENGWVKGIQGLEDGTYYLVETKAPEGYNLLTTEVEVEIANAGEEENSTPVIVPVTSKVENNSGTKLPTTGGFGTKLFIAIGSLLAVVSAIILVTNKRMAKEY